MMMDENHEILADLGRLPMAAPDVARLQDIRARCHAAIVDRRTRAERRAMRRQRIARVLEPALVGSLSAGYLVAILFVVLGFYGVR
jgi:type VI protein secretion system component VasF